MVTRTPEQTLYAIHAELPDAFSDSKDWLFDADPVSRIHWLKARLVSSKELIEHYEEMLARDQEKIRVLSNALVAAQLAMKQVVKNGTYRHKEQIDPLFDALAIIEPLCESFAVADTEVN